MSTNTKIEWTNATWNPDGTYPAEWPADLRRQELPEGLKQRIDR